MEVLQFFLELQDAPQRNKHFLVCPNMVLSRDLPTWTESSHVCWLRWWQAAASASTLQFGN